MRKRTKTESVCNTYDGTKIITREAANAQFLKTFSKKNDVAVKFLEVMDAVKACNPASFSIQTILYHSKPYGLEPRNVIELFDHWKKVNKNLGTIKIVTGCYDDEIIVCVS